MSKRAAERQDVLSDNLIADIVARLSRNTQVRRKLPDYGRLHIDRQLPFLAVYRRPADRPDPGTERLLLGEASYLLAEGKHQRDKNLNKLLREIVRTQSQVFGAFLLLEIWSGEVSSAEEDHHPAFRIHAPKQGVASALLESLENALLHVQIDDYKSRVEISYQDGFTPPSLPSLLTKSDCQQLGCTLLGLEIRPIYRDEESLDLFPFELRKLHHAFARALKRSFYTFAHRCTGHRPAHFHALGRRAMTTAVWETDKRLAEISSRFDLLLHVTPTNTEAAFNEFKRQRCARTPNFRYRPRQVDPALVKRELFQIPLERIEDPTLAHIFASKRDELDRQLTLIGDRETARFLPGCVQIYGQPDEPLLQLARDILEQLPAHASDAKASHSIDADAFVGRAEEELAYYQQQYPELPARVEVRDDVPGVMVSQGNLLVNRHLQVPAARVNATLAHEVGTHIVTYFNGRAQPFQQLYAGMANYEPLQEGLAVLAEYLVGEIGRPRLRLLAGRVMAVQAVVLGADFVETFRELHDRWGFNQQLAFMIAMRVLRGGGYIKDIVYLRGLVALLGYLKNGGDLEQLYLGKIPLEHVPFLEELRWRKVLNENLLRPRYLELPAAQRRLEKLGQGITVLQLLEDVS